MSRTHRLPRTPRRDRCGRGEDRALGWASGALLPRAGRLLGLLPLLCILALATQGKAGGDPGLPDPDRREPALGAPDGPAPEATTPPVAVAGEPQAAGDGARPSLEQPGETAAAPAEAEASLPAQSLPVGALAVGNFSGSGGELPEGWEPLEFEKIPAHTRYTLEQQEGVWAVRADSDASASGLIRKIDLDLARYPILRWRWRVERILDGGDVSKKSGDDYPARIYIAFKYEPERVGFLRRAQYLAGRALFGDIPISALNYLWASRARRDEVYDNPYAGSFVKMIPVESGAERLGEWVEEERNVLEDYVRAFGEDPPPVEGIAIMSDTDNTGESSTAWYGDLVFLPAPSADR